MESKAGRVINCARVVSNYYAEYHYVLETLKTLSTRSGVKVSENLKDIMDNQQETSIEIHT